MIGKIIAGAWVLAFLVFASGGAVVAEQKLTCVQYLAEMADLTEADGAAWEEINRLDASIASLQEELESLEAEIASVTNETLGVIGVTMGAFKATQKRLEDLAEILRGLAALPIEELLTQRDQLDGIAAEINALKEDKISAHPDIAALITPLEDMLAELQAKLPRQTSMEYVVNHGDNLWDIAGADAIYADPYMWPRLYRANRDNIRDPDLIYPKQTLVIPFGVSENQYLVTRGDFLTKIAAEVYNDPSKWHKIYKANREQIVDPAMVFPAQVFDIPED